MNTWTLKRQDRFTDEWTTVNTWTGQRADENAYFAEESERAAGHRFRLYRGETLVIDYDPQEAEWLG